MIKLLLLKIYIIGYVYIYLKLKIFFLVHSNIIFSLKIITSLLFLIIIRVGVPRFRYDHLSKLGWLKFSIMLLYLFLCLILILIIW